MIKVLGSLIVIFAGIGFGFHKAAKEQRRLEQGIAIKRMLYLLQGEIRYGFTPLPEAVLKISTKTEKEYQPFLKNVAKQLETHSEESFAKVWQQAAEKKLKQVIYEPKFYEILKNMGETIGYLDQQMQEKSDLTSVFIPAKEILSNAWNLDAAVKMGNVEFDDTYLDIIAAAKIDISRGVDSAARKKYLKILQQISSGKVTLHEDRFYLKPGTQAKLEFNLVAEGLRKIALLWQLIKNGTLEKGSVLFWDEPEANINPKYIPVLAELLIMLEKEGVQIFVSTHDYFLSKYIEIKRKSDSNVQYISLYKDEMSKVQCEIAKEFELLEHNTIMDTFRQLYREEIGVVL